MSYTQSELNRQAILDHLHAHPGQGAQVIANAIGITRNSVQNCVKMMTRRGELARTGTRNETRYTAIATTTVSAEQIIEEIRVRRCGKGGEAKKTQVEHGIVKAPGHYIQRGGQWPSQCNSGGQGALRGVVGIQASAGML